MTSKIGLLLLGTSLIACSGQQSLHLQVEVGGRSVSKLPFVIAADQGLYEKHGVNVDLQIPTPWPKRGIERPGRWGRFLSRIGMRKWERDIIVDGHTPYMVRRSMFAREPTIVAIGATDCVNRVHIIGRRGIDSIEQLKGKRLGISIGIRTTTGFAALLLAQRMSWDAVQDISIMLNGRDVADLRDSVVDAIVASETRFAVARKEGFPILLDTREWDEPVGGNSVLVEQAWLQDSTNQEAARRFLKAIAEAVALFHSDRELALDVLARWYGIEDREIAESIYDRGAWIPRDLLPCYDGIQRTMELYDSNEMRRYQAADFYEDSIMRDLVESGYVDSLYVTGGRELP